VAVVRVFETVFVMMVRRALSFLLWAWLGLLLIGCNIHAVQSTPPPLDAPATAVASLPDPAPLVTDLAPSPTPTDAPATVTPLPLPTPTAVQGDLSIYPGDVRIYPAPEVYAGDRVSFQLQPYVPDVISVNEVPVAIYVNDQLVVSDTLASRNWAGLAEGVYQWVWDTADQVGDHEIRVVLDEQDRITLGDENLANNEAVFTVTVLDPRLLRPVEASATWITAETNCCIVYAISGTAAYRDLPELLGVVETAVNTAAVRLSVEPESKPRIYFIDRVIGQGGYAGSGMVVSYVDRQYAGGALHELLVHEAVHILDRQFAPQRIKLLAEGVAVWASGGHYKPEDLYERAAALLTMGEYIPLAPLADDFYPTQHEIGYLEAAAFVSYLIDTYGWSAFRDFYSNTTSNTAATDSAALDLNLQRYYGKTLAEMEGAWLDRLRAITPSSAAVRDLETTIRFYETMRRYQARYDPTAYFLTAWLPYPHEVIERGNPADLMRRPTDALNVTIEVMLQAAEAALRQGDYGRANVIIDSIARILDNNGSFVDPLAGSYLDIVQTVTGLGYNVKQVDLQGRTAIVMATLVNKNNLLRLNLQLSGRGWVILAN